MVGPFLKTVPVKPFSQQTLFIVPADILKRVPKSAQVEFHQIDVDTMVAYFVEPKSIRQEKRYRPVSHHGSTCLSVPKWWLVDRGATVSSIIDVHEHEDIATALVLILRV